MAYPHLRGVELEVFAYDHNGSNWEWSGLSWFSTGVSTDGDFAAWEDGERCRLCFRNPDNDDPEDGLVAVLEGIIRNGRFCKE